MEIETIQLPYTDCQQDTRSQQPLNREFDMSAPCIPASIKGQKKKKRRLEAEKFFEGALTHPHIVFFFDTV